MTDAFPASAGDLATPGIATLAGWMEADSDGLKSVAARCDSICLSVGAQLVEAVPSLDDLSERFAALSRTLGGTDLADACANLDTVATEVGTIAERMASEGRSLAALIDLNGALSHLIASVADDIRFLSAMIPVVKVESVSIADDTEGLQSFGQILEELASKAREAIGTYGATHGKLLRQLDEARTIQTAFELDSRSGLATVVSGIRDSVAALAARRTGMSGKMAAVGACTQRIGMQIAEGVVALQIGDTTRQRLEHAQEMMGLPSALGMTDEGPTDADSPLGAARSDAERWHALHRICRLAALQVTAATDEFADGIATIVGLLSNVGTASADIMGMSSDLFTSQGDSSLSFLGDLELKLKAAWGLIEDYARARATIDAVAASVVSTFADLETLGASVAALVTDMTIIGTNAIIKSYRLGVRGAGLGVIAQHLRSHALKVAQGITVLTPALGEVLVAARVFTDSLSANGTARVEALAGRTTEVLDVFRSNGTLMTAALGQLEAETVAVRKVLASALETLAEIDAIDPSLRETAAQFDATADTIEAFAAPSEQVDTALHRMLRPRYTMQTERQVHDRFFDRIPELPAHDAHDAVESILF